jgi:predicted ATP-dependent endonuclease of OLD family
MGLESVLLFNGTTAITLSDLTKDTTDYFLNLSGYNTLRLILAKEVILVEGPSDELVVQRAYKDAHGIAPIEDGVDVITVNSLAFKRFLEISKKLEIKTSVVTDNDGDLPALAKKYAEYADVECVDVYFGDDPEIKTLEPQILSANNRDVLNNVLGTTHETDIALLSYMEKNKTKCALKIFQSETVITMPEYIQNAIAK